MTAVIENETIEATEADKVDEVVDTSAFDAAIANVTLADAEDKDSAPMVAAREAYNSLNRKSKSAAKRSLKDKSSEYMLADDFDNAKLYLLLHTSAAVAKPTPGAGTSTRKSPVDKASEVLRTIHIAYQLAALRVQELGVDDITSIVPAEDPEAIQSARVYTEWLENGQDGTEPDIDNELKRAARVSIGRGPGGQGRKPGTKNKDEDNESE